MKLSQLCLGSAAIIAAYANQVIAAAPSFDQWIVANGTISGDACTSGYSCGSAITDTGFYQRMVPEETSERVFFQTIITEQSYATDTPLLSLGFSDESFISTATSGIVDLTCPNGYTCGDVIVGPTFLQREITDGSNILFITIKDDTPLIEQTLSSFGGPTPFQLFHTESGPTLKPGQRLIAAAGDTLTEQTANLQLDRTKLTPDPEYIELNQQSQAEQKIYRNIVDAEIAGVTTGADAKLSAQLSVPLNIPNSYEMRIRVLTNAGWGDFITDKHNHLAAAKKLDSGYCPEVGSDLYQNEFGAGSECLQLTIQDGGPNDGDGIADGSVAVTKGLVLKAIELVPLQEGGSTTTVEATQTTGTTTPAQGGGGAWPWWLSLALLFRLGISKRN